MATIKILDPQEAIKIAAGEVVERPAHIIKELIENSIDAGATNITIYTKKSGKDEIIITDDGSGMSEEDAKLCFAHHATSKINKVQDLDTVDTYGFRGEALSSIAAVAHVKLTTKTQDSLTAAEIIIEHGKQLSIQESSHPTGTTIQITKLFDQIPARKKFLKSNDTEWNLFVSIFQAFCLRYPHIHFKLFHDGKLSYNCPSSADVTARSAQLWSSNLHNQLITITQTTKNNITISGAISNAHYHRYNRQQMFIFVNNRWVKNIELSRAIIKGYQKVLPPQKYPATFIFLTIDPTQIDVNIHPKKEEIKFLHPGIAQKTLQDIVSDALNTFLSKSLEPSQPNDFNTVTADQTKELSISAAPKMTPVNPQPFMQTRPQVGFQSSPFTAANSSPNPIKKASLPPINKQTQEASNQTIYTQQPFTIIGQFKTTYILLEKEQELFLIDQHAAHERILYEQLKNNFENVATVQLLFPHVIKLTSEDTRLIVKHQNLFKQHGIIFEQFNDDQIIVQATPVSLQHKAIDDIVQTTLSWIKEHNFVDEQEFFKELNERIHTEKACKTACKAGDSLTHEQMTNIVKKLMTIENRFCCPHGRPTMWNLTLKEIEKQFKRDYKSSKPAIDF